MTKNVSPGKERSGFCACLSSLWALGVRRSSCALRWRLGLLCEPRVEISTFFEGDGRCAVRFVNLWLARLDRLVPGGVVRCLAQAYIAAYESAPSIRVPLESSWRGMPSCIACRLSGILKGMANIAGNLSADLVFKECRPLPCRIPSLGRAGCSGKSESRDKENPNSMLRKIRI